MKEEKLFALLSDIEEAYVAEARTAVPKRNRLKGLSVRSRFRRHRLIPAVSWILILILVCTALLSPASVLATNRDIAENDVKVFIGSSRALSNVRAYFYRLERGRLLRCLAREHAEAAYSAVVVFDDYYSAQDVTAFAEKEGLRIEHIYLWVPGETGRTSLSVKENDVQGAITRFYERAKALEGTEEFGAAEQDYIRMIDGSYGIFSITAEASAKTLHRIANAEPVAFVDVKYSEEAEMIAAEKGVDVQYIELPYKPDGAL